MRAAAQIYETVPAEVVIACLLIEAVVESDRADLAVGTRCSE